MHRYYYSLFVQAAFKHIEYDNEHPIRFAVILNQTIVDEISKLHNITLQKPFILSHRLDSTSIKLFPNITNNFTIDNLFTWVVQEYVSSCSCPIWKIFYSRLEKTIRRLDRPKKSLLFT